MSIPTFGVDPLDFHDEDDFWTAVEEERAASLGPDYSEMGYDDLSHEYDDEDAKPKQYRVRCPIHGVVDIGYVNYLHQMHRPDDMWKCHICGEDAWWVGILEPCPHCGELVDYEDTGSCNHCGKRIDEVYEPEDESNHFITLDGDEYILDDDIPF